MKEMFIFQENENYDLRSSTNLANRNMTTTHYGTDTITNLGTKLWKLAPGKIKNASPLSVFNCTVKHTTDNCPFSLYKTFVKNLGFTEVCPNLYRNP